MFSYTQMSVSSEVISSVRFRAESSVQMSVVIPVYNKEKDICLSIRRLQDVLNSILLSYELVIVNDGSTDNTLPILRREESADPRLRVISYLRNKGKGYAVKNGIMQARSDVALFIDGDLDIDPNTLKNYILEFENYDLVIGSKRHPLSKINGSISRMFLSRAFNIVVRATTGIKIKDTQSGLKGGKTAVLRRIFKTMSVKRYAFDVELLTIATILNLRIKEMPIEIKLYHRFKLREIGVMIMDIAAIFYRSRIKRCYQKMLAETQDQ
jgi:glycosyltransferase involved in cell wall biosynthesis